jgi:hypothetical protein
LDVDEYPHNAQSDALVKYTAHDQSEVPLPKLPPLKIYKLNELFASVAPTDLPPFPASTESNPKLHPTFNLPEYSEAVTYHPLIIEALHSVLLCHCLIQTSTKEHLRHAYMAARLIQACDAAPIFLAARSPARSDWMEIIRRSGNFPTLENSWEYLCDPTSATAQQTKQSQETPEQRRERIKQQAIEGALGDERVVDEESFKLSVRAREELAVQEEEEVAKKNRFAADGHARARHLPAANGTNGAGAAETTPQQQQPPPPSQSDKRPSNHAVAAADATISSDRAQAIYMWMRDAPPSASDGSGRSRKKKSAAQRGRKGPCSHGTNINGGCGEADGDADGVAGLERSVESLEVD